jgi:hypothetical protein
MAWVLKRSSSACALFMPLVTDRDLLFAYIRKGVASATLEQGKTTYQGIGFSQWSAR